MKKFESVYLLQVRQYIYKFLIIIAAMTAAYLILLYGMMLKYSVYGLQIALNFARVDLVYKISFALCSVLYLIASMIGTGRSITRYKMLQVSKGQIFLAGILAAITMYLLWYGFTILDFFLIGWLYKIDPSYCGGPQGVIYSFLITEEVTTVLPLRQPVLFLRNIATLIIAGALINTPAGLLLRSKSHDKADKKYYDEIVEGDDNAEN